MVASEDDMGVQENEGSAEKADETSSEPNAEEDGDGHNETKSGEDQEDAEMEELEE